MKTFKYLFAAVLCLATTQDDGWEKPSPSFEWDFPRDNWAHEDFRTEWWYVTGFLDGDADSRAQYAYQFTFFRIGVSPTSVWSDSRWSARSIVMGHATIIDLTNGTHRFAETLHRGSNLLSGIGVFPESTLAWARPAGGSSGEWRLATDGQSYTATMQDDNVGIGMNLVMAPTKPRVFQGPNGFSKKNASGTAASMYYTLPRMSVEGSIAIGNEQVVVRGTGWMDREFSSGTLSERQIGWDWFGLQLDDGRDIMMYVLRDSSGVMDYGHATVINPSGQPTYLSSEEWSLNPTGSWTSDSTGITYPMGWTLKIDREQIDVELTPMMLNQENVSTLVPRLNYWEGAVTVVDKNGVPIGRGFGELTGYGGSRPAV